ncbi:PRP38-domain-containing protein [Xylona heveae TC161]|uniref:Pre-mRNA-splicing factor 38 n=1 Tax=Xylona heveae (strain CBS 132557 / TC161) TaxID=1328760 RepID=A0A165H573_XYLHT|nr:PRP38-domain-containing protein [Xylona heveae TC161]KZF23000.1 PRP38-domain-containing protein [Xylona heveae TC161]
MSGHKADAKALLDDRGYSGPLIRGENPANLIEKPLQDRITETYYWKEQCFALNEASLCDRAVDMNFIGGTYGQQKASPFLCLVFKLLQLQPEREIVLYYLHNEEGFKYLTALAAFYIRLTFEPVEIYKALEPLLSDYRKLRRRRNDGFMITHMDQFIDDLLTKDRMCGTTLWKLPKRQLLEDLELLDERVSPLADEIEAIDNENDDAREGDESREGSDYERRNGANGRSRSRSRSSEGR